VKVGLVTLNAQTYNYGGLLQEYALFRVLQKLGHQAEIINYDISSELNTFSYKRSIRYLSIEKVIRKIRKKFVNRKGVDDTTLNKASMLLFDKFRSDNLLISKRYTFEELSEVNDDYDGFVCGSDQIWNPAYNIPSFFLSFVKEKTKVVYAASIGVSSLSSVEKQAYKSLLKDLRHVSVREKRAKDIIAPLTSEQVEVVLDPTMILGREEWHGFVKKDNMNSPYVFCYFLEMNSEKLEAAKSFASRNGMQIVFTPFENSAVKESDDAGAGPVEFLNLIYNASFILTDSFHASVFSIIFDKPFRVFGRNIRTTNMNERLYTLLDLIGRKDLFIHPDELGSVNAEAIKYDFVAIDSLRIKSIQWLNDALKGKTE